MYDNLHLHFQFPEPFHEYEAALAASPAFASNNGQIDANGRIRLNYRGLRVEYCPGEGWGRVRGSLHTFSQGRNVGVFTAAEVTSACTDLAASLNLAPELLVVRKLEAGVNLVVPTSPRPFLETLNCHKKSPFWPLSPPPGFIRPLEYVAVHADYKLKYYDKGAYAGRQGIPLPLGCRHLLRFEVVFTRARVLNQITGRATLTLADLADPAVLDTVADHLHQRWHESVRHVPLNYSGLSMGQAALLRAGQDLKWWEDVRPSIPLSTYKKNRLQFNKLQKEAMKRVEPHPYDLLLPEHLQALRPAHPSLERPRFGTVLHTCNHVEFDDKVNPKSKRIMSIVNHNKAAALAA